MKKKEIVQEIISKAINNVKENPLMVKENGCAACHVLFTLSKEMEISEQMHPIYCQKFCLQILI